MTTSTTSPFGASIKRREDPRLISGLGTYVDDIKMVGMLHLALVRSPYAHASITSVDTSAAKAVEGVVAVYTGEELADQLGSLICGWVVPDTKEVPHPPLAIGKVRCVGDAVAAVVATDPSIAVDAAALVDVDYEPLDAVANAEEATKDGAPLVHDEVTNNKGFEWEVGGGDVDQAASESEVRVSQRIVNQRLIPNSMEGRAVITDYNPGTNHVTLWTSSQIPHLVRLLLALVTGHPEHQIRVISPDVGGGFGSKLYLYAEEVIAFVIAKDLAKPIKWIEGRQENYLATTHGRDHIGDWEITGNRDGTITGLQGTVYANMGAYLSTFAPAIPTYLFGLMLVGPYTIPNIRCKVIGVFTHTTPVDAYRGAGRPEATYVVERMLDLFAAEIGMDPVEVRRKNLIPAFSDGYEVATGVSYDSGNYEAALDMALGMIGYDDFRKEQAEARKQGRYLGVGLSTYVEICGMAPSAVAYALGARAGVWRARAGAPHRQGDGIQRSVGARPGPRDHLRPGRRGRIRHTGRRRRGRRERHRAGAAGHGHVRQPQRGRRRHGHTHERDQDKGQGEADCGPHAGSSPRGRGVRGRQALRAGRARRGEDVPGDRPGVVLVRRPPRGIGARPRGHQHIRPKELHVAFRHPHLHGGGGPRHGRHQGAALRSG